MSPDIYSVLTGDVVDSGSLESYGDALDEVFRLFERDFGDKLPLGVDRYSGDRFQFLLSEPGLSLRGALYLFTWLASRESPVPVRVSVGIGKIDGVPEQRVSTGEGEAFRLSGSRLDEMRKHQRLALETSTVLFGSEVNKLLGGSMDLLSALLMDLTPVQAEIIWYKLKGLTQNEIARETGRTQQTVSDISIAGSWRNIDSFLEVFEGEFVEVLNNS